MHLPNDQDISGRTFNDSELENLARVLKSGTLTSTKGTAVKQLEKQFAELIGVKHAFAVTSGTAAIHTALAAINPNPGDEVITTSITDMGALSPILYQGAIPVFADVDPHTYNVNAETIAAVLSEKTRAIIATHLFGNPCDMEEILVLAAEKNIPVIEDSAQAFLASHMEKLVGSIGDIGCFSFQQGKHMTCGEGGIVVTDNDTIARQIFLYINKAWGYGDPNPDHYFLALNYRLSELQGAVALAQLDKLEGTVQTRIELANKLTDKLAGLNGIETPRVHNGNIHSYWRYCLRVDPDLVRGGTVGLSQSLKEYGIYTGPRYIQKPAFMCEIFRDQKTFGSSRYPFNLARKKAIDYNPSLFQGTYDALDKILVIPWNEKFTDTHVEYIADSIKKSLNQLNEEVS
ncbi:MAG: DegT/DnrJ/EryC1/StrS family aminotransferase [Candidatus Aminicenantes bacterium]|nr:DegT/DnrJ/EryC1/StrS family aminotransferase [Candidatus Aminicenantes bacterium]